MRSINMSDIPTVDSSAEIQEPLNSIPVYAALPELEYAAIDNLISARAFEDGAVEEYLEDNRIHVIEPEPVVEVVEEDVADTQTFIEESGLDSEAVKAHIEASIVEPELVDDAVERDVIDNQPSVEESELVAEVAKDCESDNEIFLENSVLEAEVVEESVEQSGLVAEAVKEHVDDNQRHIELSTEEPELEDDALERDEEESELVAEDLDTALNYKTEYNQRAVYESELEAEEEDYNDKTFTENDINKTYEVEDLTVGGSVEEIMNIVVEGLEGHEDVEKVLYEVVEKIAVEGNFEEEQFDEAVALAEEVRRNSENKSRLSHYLDNVELKRESSITKSTHSINSLRAHLV